MRTVDAGAAVAEKESKMSTAPGELRIVVRPFFDDAAPESATLWCMQARTMSKLLVAHVRDVANRYMSRCGPRTRREVLVLIIGEPGTATVAPRVRSFIETTVRDGWPGVTAVVVASASCVSANALVWVPLDLPSADGETGVSEAMLHDATLGRLVVCTDMARTQEESRELCSSRAEFASYLAFGGGTFRITCNVDTCDEPAALMCTACGYTPYCSLQCAHADRSAHAEVCAHIQAERTKHDADADAAKPSADAMETGE